MAAETVQVPQSLPERCFSTRPRNPPEWVELRERCPNKGGQSWLLSSSSDQFRLLPSVDAPRAFGASACLASWHVGPSMSCSFPGRRLVSFACPACGQDYIWYRNPAMSVSEAPQRAKAIASASERRTSSGGVAGDTVGRAYAAMHHVNTERDSHGACCLQRRTLRDPEMAMHIGVSPRGATHADSLWAESRREWRLRPALRLRACHGGFRGARRGEGGVQDRVPAPVSQLVHSSFAARRVGWFALLASPFGHSAALVDTSPSGAAITLSCRAVRPAVRRIMVRLRHEALPALVVSRLLRAMNAWFVCLLAAFRAMHMLAMPRRGGFPVGEAALMSAWPHHRRRCWMLPHAEAVRTLRICLRVCASVRLCCWA